ncbi:MAG: hypothetical protein U0361_13975 [Nitrospiraceae bacterium]
MLGELKAGLYVFLRPLFHIVKVRLIAVPKLREQPFRFEDRIFLLPFLQQLTGHILGGVVFRMAVHPHRFEFEKRWAPTGTRLGNRLLG